MSQFNAKNLTYDKSEPAFLQRMKAGYASQDGRSNVQHARPSKSRLKMGDGDEDDGPVILDESGDIVERGVWEGMVRGEVDGKDKEKNVIEGEGKSGKEGGEKVEAKEKVEEREGQKVAEVGAPAVKKRKVVKVVGGAEDESERADEASVKQKSGAKSAKNEQKPPSEKSRKKAKKIKLSFDDPE